MAPSLFSKRFLRQIRLHAQVRIHPLRASVFPLHGHHLADHARIHPAILDPSFVERRVAHAMLTAKLGHRHATLAPGQDRKDSGFAVSRHLHLNLLMYLTEKTLLMQPLPLGRDGPTTRVFTT